MKDSQMHVVASVAAPILGGVLAALFILSTASQRGCEADKDDDAAVDKYTVIEASLAMKKDKKATQPQKPPKAPEETKQEGVSHDETKKPPAKKDDPKKVDNTKPLSEQFKHKNDDDSPPNKAPQTQGDFNGAANGNSLVSKGDPFYGGLSADLDYTIPDVSDGAGKPP